MMRSKLILVLALAACSGSPKNPVGPGGPTTVGDGTTATNAGATTTAPATPASPPRKVVTVEGITEYHLDNGLRVLLFPDQSKDTVTVNITYLVGSRHEGYGESGMAHLLEHMLFKGTPTNPDVWKALQDHGAQFNGTTWYDRTNYYETLPATDENLTFALSMEADRMVNSTIAAEKLATEFSVVRNEFERGENNPMRVLEERIVSAAYLWHNYGKSTIGSRSDIERVPVDNLRAFYRKYYRPDNAVLVVAGKFDEKKALDLIHQHYSPLARPATALPQTYTTEPVQDGEKQVMLRRSGDAQYVGVLYHTVPGAHVDSGGLDAAADILTAEPSGRLYKALVEKKLATKVWSSQDPTKEPGYITFFAEVPNGKSAEQVRDKMLAIIEGLDETEITPAEVSRYVRKQQKAFSLYMADTQQIAIVLTEFTAMGDWRLLFITRDRLDAIDAGAVKSVAGKYFKRSNRTVGMFVPTKDVDRAPLPEQPDVAALVKDYKGRKSLSEGEVFAATFDNIEARTERHTMKGGMKVAMLSKKTKGHTIEGRINLYYGSEKDLKGKTTAADLAADMLMRGTTKRGYQELSDELDRLKAAVNIANQGPGQAVVTFTTTRENFPDVLALLAEVLQQPAFAADQFALVTTEQITTLEGQLQDPQAQAITALQRTFKPYAKSDIRYVPTIQEQIDLIKKTKLADVKKVHQQLWGASHATAAFVGDFDADELKSALETHFGTWKSKKPFKRIASTFTKNDPAPVVIQTPDKKMAIILAAKTLEVRDDDPEYAGLVISGYVLGGGASSRLLTRLRHNGGLSYGAFGGIQASSLDKVGALFGGAILAPENVDKGMAALLDELEKLISAGIPAKELDDAKAAYAKQTQTQLASDEFLATELANNLYLGRTMQFDKQLEAKIGQLTSADIARALKAHISAQGLTQITAGDLPK